VGQILVTGGTGFIGQALVQRLLTEGRAVRVMARDPISPVAREQRRRGAEVVKGDMLDSSTFPAAVDGCEGLIHLAAWFEIGAHNRARMLAINVQGTDSLLSVATAAGLERVVHVGSVLAYGPSHTGCHPAEPPDSETLAADPRNSFTGIFEESKYLAVRIALRHASQGAPVVVVCPGTVLGPEDPSQFGTTLRLCLQRKVPFLLGRTSCFSLLSLQDAVDGILKAYGGGRIGEVYPLISEILSVERVARAACKVARIKPPRWDLPRWVALAGLPFVNLQARIRGGRPVYSREALAILSENWGYDASLSRRTLGWQPLPIQMELDTIAHHHMNRKEREGGK
jgi:dihydroflavonol-4-reductase